MKEVWRDIVGYEGLYQVSNLGRVKSKRCVLKPYVNHKGYLKVGLSKESSNVKFRVHRLVYEAFVGCLIKGKVVDHIDNVKSNNYVNNLQLISNRLNTSKDKFRKNYTSNFVGVYYSGYKYNSIISIKGTSVHLGSFSSDVKASLIYKLAVVNVDKYIDRKQFRSLIKSLI